MNARAIHTGWYLVACYAIFAILLPLFQNGIFTDGSQYAAVARNMALGDGTFWGPHLAQNLHPQFHQGPPFMLWLQSLFFNVVGTENIYPERIFCAIFLLLTVWAMAQTWGMVSGRKDGWWPVLIWLLVPTVAWGFINNIAENVLTLFDLLSVYFIYQYMRSRDWEALFFAIAFLFLASFTKGIQGLFPIAAPVLYCWAVDKKFITKKAFITSAILLLSMVVVYALMLQIPAAKESYRLYFESRFPNFPHTPHSNTGNRLLLLFALFMELATPLAIIAVLGLVSYILNRKKPTQKSRPALFFLLVALSASLPILVSYEQRGFYLNTSIPYFALALALVFYPTVATLSNHIQSIKLKYTLGLVAIAGIALTIYKAGDVKRDADKLADVATLRQLAGDKALVYTDMTVWDDWAFHNYLQRFAQISLSLGTPQHGYFITAKNGNKKTPEGFTPAGATTQYVSIFLKK